MLFFLAFIYYDGISQRLLYSFPNPLTEVKILIDFTGGWVRMVMPMPRKMMTSTSNVSYTQQ